MASFRNKLSRLPSAGPGSAGSGPPTPRPETPPPDAPIPATGSERQLRAKETLDRVIATHQSRLRRGRDEDAFARDDDAGGLLASVLRSRAPKHAPPPPAKPLLGERRETRHGPVHTVDQYLEPHHCHGRVAVASALSAEGSLIARLALDPAFEEVDLRRALFVDTETTGLSTAAGTVPFLIGVAYFEDESLRVEQLLLTKLGEEGPMLRRLAELIERASCVVSYNGKSFDWPLLRTRYVMNRVPSPALPPHLDLLHCSRRLYAKRYGGRLESVRLVNMEVELLGFTREHDIDGAEVPSVFLNFVRSGNPGRLDAVLEHNANDLVALAALLGELHHKYREMPRADAPEDQLRYALVSERAKDGSRAGAFAQAAARGGGTVATTIDALLLRARVARRAKEPQLELEALSEALHHVLPDDARTPLAGMELRRAQVHLELAKLHEHRLKDLERALLHARQTSPAETEGERDKRISRVLRRLSRA